MGLAQAEDQQSPHRTLVFSDLSQDPNRILKKLFASSQSSTTLGKILEGSAKSLRREYAGLCREDLARIAPFRSFHDLVRASEAGSASDIVSTIVLTTIAQFGSLGL